MGNIDTRASFSFGYLMLQTDKPFYEPGEVITGRVFLRANVPIDAQSIDIEVKGKEHSSFRVFRTVTS
jgi:hypothetical protein